MYVCLILTSILWIKKRHPTRDISFYHTPNVYKTEKNCMSCFMVALPLIYSLRFISNHQNVTLPPSTVLWGCFELYFICIKKRHFVGLDSRCPKSTFSILTGERKPFYLLKKCTHKIFFFLCFAIDCKVCSIPNGWCYLKIIFLWKITTSHRCFWCGPRVKLVFLSLYGLR